MWIAKKDVVEWPQICPPLTTPVWTWVAVSGQIRRCNYTCIDFSPEQEKWGPPSGHKEHKSGISTWENRKIHCHISSNPIHFDQNQKSFWQSSGDENTKDAGNGGEITHIWTCYLPLSKVASLTQPERSWEQNNPGALKWQLLLKGESAQPSKVLSLGHTEIILASNHTSLLRYRSWQPWVGLIIRCFQRTAGKKCLSCKFSLFAVCQTTKMK